MGAPRQQVTQRPVPVPAFEPAGERSLRRRDRMVSPLSTAAVVIGGCAAVGLVDPNRPGHYPTCPFLWVSGWYCPGCGSLRAVHALTHGDVQTAVDRNVLLVLAIPAIGVGWVRWARRRWRGDLPTGAPPQWLLWGLVAVVLAFWVLRNLAVGAWLSPT